MPALKPALDQPGGSTAQDSQDKDQEKAQGRIAHDGVCQGDAAEYTDQRAEHPEDFRLAGVLAVQIPHITGSLGYLMAEVCVLGAGAVHGISLAEEGFKYPYLVGIPLVAHLHPLVQVNAAVFLHLDEDVAQLCPGKYHHRKIRAAAAESAGDLAGGEAVGRCGGASAPEGSAPQENHPIDQCQGTQHDHNDLHGADGLLAHRLSGEHFVTYRHQQGQGLQILQIRGDLAGDLVALHRKFHRGLNALLIVAAAEGGIQVLRQHTGHSDGEGELFDAVGKARQQRQSEHQFLLLVISYCVGHSILQVHGEIAGGISYHTTQSYLADAVVGIGAGGIAVDGDAAGIEGNGKGEVFIRCIQPEVQFQIHNAGAVSGDGSIEPGVSDAGRRRHRKCYIYNKE